jgi:hypothetical protein
MAPVYVSQIASHVYFPIFSLKLPKPHPRYQPTS